MEWKTISITPKSASAREFITTYPDRREQFMSDLNSKRLQKFSNEEQIFEFDLDLLASSSSTTATDKLFFKDISRLLRENGCRWKKQLLKLGSDKSITNTIDSYRSHLLNIGSHSNFHPEIGKQGFHIDSLNQTLQLFPTSAESKKYKYTLDIDKKDIPQTKNIQLIELRPSELKIRLYTHSEVKNSDNSSSDTKSLRPLIFLRLLGVSHGDASFAQVSVSQSKKNKLTRVLNKLNLRWEKVTDTTYFIVDSTDKYQEAYHFINQDQTKRSLSQYYSLFDFPVESTDHITSKLTAGTVINLSGEEVFIYALCNNKVSAELAQYATFIQFRPEPTIESIVDALQFTKKYEESVDTATDIITEINSNTTEELYTLYLNEKEIPKPWPVLPVEENLLA